MLKSYFDESGTHGHARSTVIGGYVGNETSWDDMETRWQEILHTYGLRCFHMADALAHRGEFARIESCIVRDICQALVNVLHSSDIHAVWSGVEAGIWKSATTQEFREAFPKPYDLCFLEILRNLQAWQRDTRQFGQISMVFATQDEYQRRSVETLKSWARSRKRSAWPIGFDSPKNVPALQAADLLVHELYVSLNTLKLNGDHTGKISVTPLLTAATKGDMVSGGYITENALKLRVANRDWLDPNFTCPADRHRSSL